MSENVLVAVYANEKLEALRVPVASLTCESASDFDSFVERILVEGDKGMATDLNYEEWESLYGVHLAECLVVSQPLTIKMSNKSLATKIRGGVPVSITNAQSLRNQIERLIEKAYGPTQRNSGAKLS